jgi:hypothetical protein
MKFAVLKVFLLAFFALTQSHADAIKINLEDLDKIISSQPTQQRESVMEVLPISGSIPKVNHVERMPKAIEYSEQYSATARNQTRLNPNEEAREEFIKSLRLVIEKGKDFKYYFPNFDYQAAKKEIEQMMRDSVSQ